MSRGGYVQGWLCPGGGYVQGVVMSGGWLCPGGGYVQGVGTMPPQGKGPRDTVGKQVVRILLECFVVLDCGLCEQIIITLLFSEAGAIKELFVETPQRLSQICGIKSIDQLENVHYLLICF